MSKHAETVNYAINECLVVRDLIEELLSTERGEDGSYEVESIEVDVNELVEWRDRCQSAAAELTEGWDS